MGELESNDPREAAAAEFNQQQEAQARAEQLKGTSQEQALADLAGLKKSVENPMGLPEKLEGLDAKKPVENLPGIIDEVVKLRQGGMKREEIPDAVLREIPQEDRQAFLDRIDEIAAETPAKTETAEATGPQTITLESGVAVNVGDLVQVEDIKGNPAQVRIKSFDDKGGSVQVEDLDATGKSAGGRGGNAEQILKGAKVIKA